MATTAHPVKDDLMARNGIAQLVHKHNPFIGERTVQDVLDEMERIVEGGILYVTTMLKNPPANDAPIICSTETMGFRIMVNPPHCDGDSITIQYYLSGSLFTW